MIKNFLKWGLLVVLVAYTVFAAIWAHAEARKNECKGIDITVNGNTTADETTRNGILAELKEYPDKIVGSQINTIDTKRIENFLDSMPQFEDVECSITASGRLNINILPMIPAVRVFDAGQSYYINKDGKRMDSKAGFYVDVPVVTGNFNDRFTPVDVLPMVRFVKNDPVMDNLVGMIHAADDDNIFLVPRIQGHLINFGDTTDLGEKRRALLTFYRKVMPYKGWEEYDTISSKFKGQIVATRRDKSRRFTSPEFVEDVDMEEATLPETEIAM